MFLIDKMNKAIVSLERSKELYLKGDKRLALGEVDWAEERLEAIKWLLIAMIEEEREKL